MLLTRAVTTRGQHSWPYCGVDLGQQAESGRATCPLPAGRKGQQGQGRDQEAGLGYGWTGAGGSPKKRKRKMARGRLPYMKKI